MTFKENRTSNQLLEMLEPTLRKRIEPYFQTIDLKFGAVICESGGEIDQVYFPLDSAISLLTVLEDGSEIETANIGNEGAYGIFNAIYSYPVFNRSIIQMPGRVIRVPVKQIKWGFDNSEHMRKLVVTYSSAQSSQIQQSVACNARHSTEKRICRWLLMMNDRAPDRELPYTHEFLSSMLGANRKSVTLAAQSLQNRGLIKYQRGKIFIVNRKGLEQASCECYAVVNRFNFLIEQPNFPKKMSGFHPTS